MKASFASRRRAANHTLPSTKPSCSSRFPICRRRSLRSVATKWYSPSNNGPFCTIPKATKKTIELEPAAGLPYAMLALAYAQMGQRTETLQTAENAIRLADSPTVMATTASALARVGESVEARQFISKALEQAKERYVCQFIVGAAYAELGETEHAIDSLEKGLLQRST